jgi:hypothetical protein
MNLPEQRDATFYKVFYSNQQSSIRKTTQQEAKLIIQQESHK